MHIHEETSVSQHDALRGAGGAGGVDHGSHIIGGDGIFYLLKSLGLRMLTTQGIEVVDGGNALDGVDGEDLDNAGHLFADGRDLLVEVLALDDNVAYLGMVEDIFVLGLADLRGT